MKILGRGRGKTEPGCGGKLRSALTVLYLLYFRYWKYRTKLLCPKCATSVASNISYRGRTLTSFSTPRYKRSVRVPASGFPVCSGFQYWFDFGDKPINSHRNLKMFNMNLINEQTFNRLIFYFFQFGHLMVISMTHKEGCSLIN